MGLKHIDNMYLVYNFFANIPFDFKWSFLPFTDTAGNPVGGGNYGGVSKVGELGSFINYNERRGTECNILM